MGAAAGEISPSQLSESGRRHLARMCRNLGLSVAALSAESLGLADPRTVDECVARTLPVLELAADLRVPVVVADVGPITDRDTEEPSSIAVDALRALADHAGRVGTRLALQTGPDSPEGLGGVLNAVDCPWLGVCVDPAMLVRYGHSPSAAIERLAEALLLSHLGDATSGGRGRTGLETQLGQGQLDLPAFLADLSAAGYHGPLILRRRDCRRPRDELAAAKRLLETYLD